jgi:hypothetical protein
MHAWARADPDDAWAQLEQRLLDEEELWPSPMKESGTAWHHTGAQSACDEDVFVMNASAGDLVLQSSVSQVCLAAWGHIEGVSVEAQETCMTSAWFSQQ